MVVWEMSSTRWVDVSKYRSPFSAAITLCSLPHRVSLNPPFVPEDAENRWIIWSVKCVLSIRRNVFLPKADTPVWSYRELVMTQWLGSKLWWILQSLLNFTWMLHVTSFVASLLITSLKLNCSWRPRTKSDPNILTDLPLQQRTILFNGIELSPKTLSYKLTNMSRFIFAATMTLYYFKFKPTKFISMIVWHRNPAWKKFFWRILTTTAMAQKLMQI